jgi:hypothetical protein
MFLQRPRGAAGEADGRLQRHRTAREKRQDLHRGGQGFGRFRSGRGVGGADPRGAVRLRAAAPADESVRQLVTRGGSESCGVSEL